jgi:hypothetical protein
MLGGLDVTIASQKMTIPIGYNQDNDEKSISLKSKLLPVQKITNALRHTWILFHTELIAKPNEVRPDACKDSMNDNYYR